MWEFRKGKKDEEEKEKVRNIYKVNDLFLGVNVINKMFGSLST